MSYLLLSPSERQRAIRRAIKTIRDSKLKFDSIACTGVSGLLVAPAVAARLGVPIIVVRKDETSHGEDVEFECDRPPLRYVIVDDLVESGKTIANVQKRMSNLEFGNRKVPKCVGIYFYNQSATASYFDRYQSRHPKMWMRANI